MTNYLSVNTSEDNAYDRTETSTPVCLSASSLQDKIKGKATEETQSFVRLPEQEDALFMW